MKITAVETIVYPNPGRPFVWVLVRTDEGLTGLGEATLMGRDRTVVATLSHLADVIVGEDPLRREHIWNRLFMGDRRRGGAALGSAMGAIDVALWDIHGQALGIPLHALLGGRVRDRVWFYNHARPTSPESVSEAFGPLAEGGWNAAKFMPLQAEPDGDGRLRIDVADSIRRGTEIVAAARDFVGPEFELLIETHGRLRPVEAIDLARRIQEYEPMFIEEPTRPEAVATFRLLREKIDIPIATGERLYHRWAFQPLIEEELVDYLQPDIVHAHGLTEVKRIADYADTHLLKMAPHNPQSPVNTMASIHLDLVIPNFAIQEIIWPFPRFLYELFDRVPEIRDGYAEPPTAPGLGIKLNEERARQIEYEPSAIDELMLSDGTYTEF